MEFQLLGPVRAWMGGEPVDLGVRKQRFVLTMLLLEANRHVSADRLVELTWPDGAPDSARAVIHTQVSRLRSVLSVADDVSLVREGSGYLLQCDPGQIDWFRFRTLAAQARTGPDEQRIELLEQALALWEGPALSSITAEDVRLRLARPLDEARLTAQEDRFDAYLRLNRHAEIMHELTELAAEHPDRQQLVARLMLALHRSDRTPEALTAYQDLYQRLNEELGLEPAPALRQLHLQILRDDPELQPFSGPRQLPPDVDHYAGRGEQLGTLVSLLRPGSTLPVVAITGKPGLGKTALAVRAAHRVSSAFPDGQLFVDLHGAGASPRDPAEVLARFLRDLGVASADIPATLEERAGLFRDRTATRQVLVVLDNASSEDQVRPLFPGNPSCAVLITSRRRLTGLDMRDLIDLDGLDDADALALLTDLAPQVSPSAAARKLVRLCGGLPLALRIVGTRLRSRPHQTVEDLAARLEDSRNRLDELVGGDREIRAGFELSYDSLTGDEQRAFRVLAPLPTFPVWAAAAALGVEVRAAERLLDSLLDANLLESGPSGRYYFHDLIRLYAKELLSAEEREEARVRLAAVYVNLGMRADAKLEFGGLHRFEPPPLTIEAPRVEDDPVGWFTEEHPSILLAVEEAAAVRDDETTCRLSALLAAFLELQAQWADLKSVASVSLAAAERMRSPYWTAYALLATGLAARETRDFAASERAFRQGLTILPAAGDSLLEVVTLLSVGVAKRLQGQWDEAAGYFAECLSTLEGLDEPRWRAYTLREYGVLYRYRGQWAEAIECLTEAVSTYHELGNSRWEGASLRELGIVHQDMGDRATAADMFSQSLELLRIGGDRRRMGAALRCLAWSALLNGDLAAARNHAIESRELLLSTLDTHGLACTEVQLSDIHLALGDLSTAKTHLDAGVTRLSTSGDPRWRAKSQISLGRYHQATGNHQEAVKTWRQALETLEKLGAHETDAVRALLAAE
ncbi:BTAD domain-containing putative transcriptional regulator [Actinocrispum sp. NPDC049592]|uniref:AfsR/SARP family transcriptional regulator n=1 Tax=Actinocrispum sp. NPDC049592 TaxID=3154835 RepID=UPI00341DD5E7